jgi:hypothetical protein
MLSPCIINLSQVDATSSRCSTSTCTYVIFHERVDFLAFMFTISPGHQLRQSYHVLRDTTLFHPGLTEPKETRMARSNRTKSQKSTASSRGPRSKPNAESTSKKVGSTSKAFCDIIPLQMLRQRQKYDNENQIQIQGCGRYKGPITYSELNQL